MCRAPGRRVRRRRGSIPEDTMTTTCNRLAAAAGAAVLTVVWSSAADAQKPQRTRSIQVKPDNRFGAVDVELQLETVRRGDGAAAGVRTGDPVQVGDNVVLCFRSSADGYVTVWSQDAEGDVPVRIYPNEYAAETADERAAAVVAGEETWHRRRRRLPSGGRPPAGGRIGVSPLHAAGGAAVRRHGVPADYPGFRKQRVGGPFQGAARGADPASRRSHGHAARSSP